VSDVAFPTSPILPRPSLAETLAPKAQALLRRPTQGAAERAAKDFESVLLYRLLEEMKRTIPSSGLLENGISEQVRDLFWYYLAQDLADKGGLGMWKELYRQMNPASGPGGAGPEQAP